MESRCVNSSLNTSRLWFIIDYTSSLLHLLLLVPTYLVFYCLSIEFFIFSNSRLNRSGETKKRFDIFLTSTKKQFESKISIEKLHCERENFSGESKLYD